MKLQLKDPVHILNDKLQCLMPIIIRKEEYDEYIKYSKNGFILTNKWVVHIYSKKSKDTTNYFIQAISTYLEIKYCQQNISSNKRKYHVVLFNGITLIEKDFGSEILTSAGCKCLLEHGCVFDESNIKALLSYISHSVCDAPVKYVHTSLGWIKNGTSTFLTGQAISNDSIISEYIGSLDLQAKGTLENWLNMYHSDVKGNTVLEFSMLTGFASPILGYINNYLDLGCIIFNFSNSSSKGKTTAAMLSASVMGNPSFDRGLITTLNSTSNALIQFVSQANAHTVVLDEVATCEKSSFRKILYQLCSGRDRMRLNTDGEMKKLHNFNSIILTTAEFSLIDETAPNGLRARIFEITDTLTKSAENSDNIKRCIHSNYGHAGNTFIKYVIGNKIDTIIDDYHLAVNTLEQFHRNNELEYGELTHRILNKLAVIMLTADYVNDCFKLEIDLRSIINMIFRIEQSITTEADIGDKALDCIIQYVARHSNRFIYNESDYYNNAVDGKVKSGGSGKEIIILKTVVEQILYNNNFESPKTIYKLWREKKIIISEKDRPYKRVRLAKELPVQPCFIFKIRDY